VGLPLLKKNILAAAVGRQVPGMAGPFIAGELPSAR
jgi:hypothetical protein